MKDPRISDDIRPQTDSDFLLAASLMRASGGSFASRIALAYLYADSHNQARLRAAFPDLFTAYFVRYSNLPKE